MPAARDQLQWIQIRDFRPGISDDPGSNYPAGAAQRGTFQCIANRNGALVPLPKRQVPFPLPHEGAGINSAVTGIYVPPIGLLPTGGAGFNPNLYPEHELLVATETQGSGTITDKMRRYQRFSGSGDGYDTLTTATTTLSGAWRPTGVCFGTTRSNRATPRDPGCPVVVYSMAGLQEFPDDQATASVTPYQIFPPYTGGTGSGPFILNFCCHQNRVVAQTAAVFNQGPGGNTFMGENLMWSDLNDVTQANWWGVKPDPDNPALTSQPAVMVAENPSGFAFITSMSANELFAVKGHGGLYFTGDLETGGAVVSLPMVTGAEIQQMPAVDNLGVVYGNRGSGVWVWTHGPACQLLSPSMNPDFWTLQSPVYPLDDFGGISYSLTAVDEWIVTPNNWVYDTQTSGWWRLEDDSSITYRFNTGMWHYLYCAQPYYTDTNDSPIAMYDRHTPSSTYTWVSQPQWETIDTLIDIREITLRVRGSGSVTVNCIGETATVGVTFSGISAIRPVLLRQPIRVQDANIAVQIIATEPTGTGGAPTVYECNVGYFAAQAEKVTMS